MECTHENPAATSRDAELEENDQILLPKALPYLCFCQTRLPCKCRLKDVKLLLSPCEFSLFPKMDLKGIKYPVYPRINHHKYCACNCQEVSNTHSHILKSINVTLGNALRARTNEYTHFTKQHRATSTGTSLGYQSKKIIRKKTNNIQSSVTQPHVAWLKGCGGVGDGVRTDHPNKALLLHGKLFCGSPQNLTSIL